MSILYKNIQIKIATKVFLRSRKSVFKFLKLDFLSAGETGENKEECNLFGRMMQVHAFILFYIFKRCFLLHFLELQFQLKFKQPSSIFINLLHNQIKKIFLRVYKVEKCFILINFNPKNCLNF